MQDIPRNIDRVTPSSPRARDLDAAITHRVRSMQSGSRHRAALELSIVDDVVLSLVARHKSRR
jgi:hypothetical protein